LLAEIPWRNLEIDPMAIATIETRISSVPTGTTAGHMTAIVVRVIGDYYDSPLKSGKQRPDVKSLDELSGGATPKSRCHRLHEVWQS
jgi:hypothetical protein